MGIKYRPKVSTSAQNAELTAMYAIILTGFNPNEVATIAPPIGVNIIGVKNATPLKPNLFQTLTIRLFAGDIFFSFRKNIPFTYL